MQLIKRAVLAVALLFSGFGVAFAEPPWFPPAYYGHDHEHDRWEHREYREHRVHAPRWCYSYRWQRYYECR